MDHLNSLSYGKHRSLYFYTVVFGILWTVTAVRCLEYQRVSRKLLSSPEPDLDEQFSHEDIRKLITLLGGSTQTNPSINHETTTERASAMQHNAMILPELMRSRPAQPIITTTENPPISRVTTRRFYRRLRRKTTTTEFPETTSTLKTSNDNVESARMLPTDSSSGDLLQQISLLNGILGAIKSTAQTPTTAQPSTNSANANDNATPIPNFLALFSGAKPTGEASSKSEVIVPPPPASPLPPVTQQNDDPAAALALLNLFSNGAGSSQNKGASENGNNAAANLLNLVTQSQQHTMQPSAVTGNENDATAAALTRLLLQNSVPPASPAMQGNSLVQSMAQQPSADASANQLNNLLGLLGTLGAAAGQQSQSGNINQLFGHGGDQVAQAQTNSLAQLFGQQTQPQQLNQANALLSLLGGAQGNQGLGLASLLDPQGGNGIPGLGLLSTVSSLGSTLFSTVSNLFGGTRQDGKPRVRGKGVDTRLGLGYRLGNIGDAQVVWDIGPQLFTDPLRNEAKTYTQKRESGSPKGAHYFQSPSATATEKEVQQIEAKRRMVQAAIQDHYRGDHFASVYPKPSQRRSSNNYYDHNSYSQSNYYPQSHVPSAVDNTASSSSSSFFSSLPFGEHLKGFWSGLTSGGAGSEEHPSSSNANNYYNFDDVRSDFSANLIKRSSPDYTEYDSRNKYARHIKDTIDDPTHTTLTDYERMLLQYGKDIGVANTQHGVVTDEPQASESGFFARWFKNPLSNLRTSTSSHSHGSSASKPKPTEWSMRSYSDDNEFQSSRTSQPQKSVKKSFNQPSPSSPTSSSPTAAYDASFSRRNNHHTRRKGQRPPKRRSHNPFRNWIASFKQSAQRPRNVHHTAGIGRRHFKRPSVSANPKLQHFTNTNKDLMMADANDDFVESAGVEGFNTGYEQPLAYNYANEFPDVSLFESAPPPPRRLKTAKTGVQSKYRASLSQSERIVEPALLYDHLEVQESNIPAEVDESFNQRNKVGINPTLKQRGKQKVLGAVPVSVKNKTPIPTLTKLQKLRLQNSKLRANSTVLTGKQKVVVKVKGDKGATPQNMVKVPGVIRDEETMSESTTAIPSVLSTISSIFSGTSKPKLLNNLIHNATSFLPSISSIRILPRKKKKEPIKTKLTLQDGKPAIVALPVPDEEDYDQDTAADGDDAEPVVQVGHDMSFMELQKIFGAKKNGTKRHRLRIRVKESVLKGDSDKDDKDRKDSDENEEDGEGGKDIFVDIESGEVSVLKPVASLVSFNPAKEEVSDEEDVDYYEDDDGDGVADADMKRKEHIFEAIQKELVRNFEKMKKAQQKAEAKKRRKQELAEKGMDESIDVVTKYFDVMHQGNNADKQEAQQSKLKSVGGLSM